ncbi:DUF4011 domain-containing protein [Mycoplasmopsis cynos]|uniref:DUF4011 domain-containing protein n=1 Tax=Mycoplasmopsis cynos TaxID=171284 RepID=UPI003A5C7E93
MFVNTIKKIAKTAKAFKEDQFSIDIMYLTFGILQWYEDKTSETPRFAPLFFFYLSKLTKALIQAIEIFRLKKKVFLMKTKLWTRNYQMSSILT